MSYRLREREIDKAQFVVATSDETGAMPVLSAQGEFKPIKVESQSEVLQICGNPSASYPSVFEALAFVKSAPLWIVPVVGDNALYSGVDVKRLSVSGESVETGDGTTLEFTATLANAGIDSGSLVIYVNSVSLDVVESDGVITGTGVTGTLTQSTGELTLTFDTAPTDEYAITADYDYASVTAFSKGKDYDSFSFTAFEDLISGESIGTGDGTTVNFTKTLSNIPVKTDTIIIYVNGVDQEITETDGVITGDTISAGSLNLTTGELDITFNTAPETSYAITSDYVYTRNASDVSFSVFAKSAYDAQFALTIENTSGSQYDIEVYDIVSTGNTLRESYEFSLLDEKNYMGQSLYYVDVLDDDMADIKLQVNTSYDTPVASPQYSTQVEMDGGDRGDDPEDSDYQTAWQYFRKPNTYKAYIFMDVIGGYYDQVKDITTTYQVQGFGLTVVPLGYDADEAIDYRDATGISSDQLAMYTNWTKIKDNYNNSTAYISNIGSIGRKMALTSDFYDQPSPAGYDDNSMGGQLQDWTPIEVENDYTDLATGGDLYNLDASQVNPVILTDEGNLIVWGDKTMYQLSTDTSYIGHRRCLNKIKEIMREQILRFKIFKNINDTNLSNMKILAQGVLDAVIATGSINDGYADTSKNTTATKDARKMILSLYIQAMPNAQIVELQVTRVGQQVTVAESAGV